MVVPMPVLVMPIAGMTDGHAAQILSVGASISFSTHSISNSIGFSTHSISKTMVIGFQIPQVFGQIVFTDSGSTSIQETTITDRGSIPL